MICGRARDVAAVVAVVHGHVRGGVGVPVDGVEEGGVVGVEDGVGAAFVVDVEGADGFGGSEHGGISCIRYGCEVWSVGFVDVSQMTGSHHLLW